MYFGMKSYLKSNHNHTAKHTLNYFKKHKIKSIKNIFFNPDFLFFHQDESQTTSQWNFFLLKETHWNQI